MRKHLVCAILSTAVCVRASYSEGLEQAKEASGTEFGESRRRDSRGRAQPSISYLATSVGALTLANPAIPKNYGPVPPPNATGRQHQLAGRMRGLDIGQDFGIGASILLGFGLAYSSVRIVELIELTSSLQSPQSLAAFFLAFAIPMALFVYFIVGKQLLVRAFKALGGNIGEAVGRRKDEPAYQTYMAAKKIELEDRLKDFKSQPEIGKNPEPDGLNETAEKRFKL